MTYSPTGLALTKSFEGLSLTAYQDQGGVWTIGYGHTGKDVYEGMTITAEQADALLIDDIGRAALCVNRHVMVSINQNQFDALVDFTFNLGCKTLFYSTLLIRVNQGNMTEAAAQFLRWDHAGGRVIPGLMRRRQAEIDLFQRSDASVRIA